MWGPVTARKTLLMSTSLMSSASSKRRLHASPHLRIVRDFPFPHSRRTGLAESENLDRAVRLHLGHHHHGLGGADLESDVNPRLCHPSLPLLQLPVEDRTNLSLQAILRGSNPSRISPSLANVTGMFRSGIRFTDLISSPFFEVSFTSVIRSDDLAFVIRTSRRSPGSRRWWPPPASSHCKPQPPARVQLIVALKRSCDMRSSSKARRAS